MLIFYFKVNVTHWRSTNCKCGLLIGDTLGRLSRHHVINILSGFSNVRGSLPYIIMMLFIYSRLISRSVVVVFVHFAIVLNNVIS